LAKQSKIPDPSEEEQMARVIIRSMPPVFADAPIDKATLFYHGDSMRRTFRNGDRLLLAPVLSFSEINPGDVIVFCSKNSTNREDNVVHRVVAITDPGLITRGDNNSFYDPFPVQLDQIIGKVDFLEDRRGNKKNITGGATGLRFARLSWATTRLNSWCRAILRKIYRISSLQWLAKKLWHPEIVQISLQIEDGQLIKYLYKHRTVAVWNAKLQKFDCRKPFDLVIPFPLEITKVPG
jgi:signal peptidase I